jgi:hypothetical protein
MDVKLSQAVKMFFGNSSLEMVYIEAVANSFDAGATEIDIKITIADYNKPETLAIEITDNGEGFTDDRTKKFGRLFDVDESSHKGLGRLVYVFYFDDVTISSVFEKTKQRFFKFEEDFDANSTEIKTVHEQQSWTTIKLSKYTLSKVKSHAFLKPIDLKNRILEEFYSRLYEYKQEKKDIKISITLYLGEHTLQESITLDDIADLNMVEFDSSTDLFDVLRLYYSIDKVDIGKESFIAALSVDNRTKQIDILAKENMPPAYKMVFLLYSEILQGKVDHSRQNLTLPENEIKDIKAMFRKEVIKVIEQEIPEIADRNENTRLSLNNRYPHLTGFFDEKNIGYVSNEDIIKKAQGNFFRAQRDVLDAQTLTDEQFDKSMELSSRALTEYVLFRQFTIDRLQKVSEKDDEAIIHNLIVPKYETFKKADMSEDIYRNNAWILDDKYMTYETILSDKKMSELVDVITEGEFEEKDTGKPDIALIFSSDPERGKPFDVVIVELKKKGLPLERNMIVETQIQSRARLLMKYYNNQIQRIWFYGIIEFNEEVETHLAGNYTELYSTGKMYYQETNIAIQRNPIIRVPIAMFILDLDSVIKDANARNSTFLNLIKSQFDKH